MATSMYSFFLARSTTERMQQVLYIYVTLNLYYIRRYMNVVLNQAGAVLIENIVQFPARFHSVGAAEARRDLNEVCSKSIL